MTDNIKREDIQLKNMNDQQQNDTTIGGGNDMTEGIMDAVKPVVNKLDEQVKNTRKSQLHLLSQMDELSKFMKKISEDQPMPYDLEKYVRKMDDSRRRITDASLRLQGYHDRLSQLQRLIARESFKKKQQLNQLTS